MQIQTAQLLALQIPFTEAFTHSIQSRIASDSIIVRLTFADGTVGYGEAVARPYVTGETVESCLQFMSERIWPAVAPVDYPAFDAADPLDWLNTVSNTIPQVQGEGAIAWNAARTGFELALLDGLLKSQNLSLSAVLPPQRSTVIYSGVITASSIEKAVKTAKHYKLFGLKQLKVKTMGGDDVERIAAIRQAVGPEVSLRIDGNGGYGVEGAIAICKALAEFQIDSAEQLLPRCDLALLAQVKAAALVPQMVDESLIIHSDAEALIAANACDWFNLRISKLGGIAATLAIAHLAQSHGIRLQLGCQVGETAILSAAGRHLAAASPHIEFVEGSYGTLLLAEDVSRDSIHFGNGGKAGLLKRPGLGIEVQDAVLEKYAQQIVHLR